MARATGRVARAGAAAEAGELIQDVLKTQGAGRNEQGLYLDRPMGHQRLEGAQPVLERDDTDNRGLPTGHY